ncbi:phage integrase SAM-like domain-containing protein [Herbaspirillum huttiense]|uniref:Phage integrase SAM-like domain-containing protein n=2 Tax=Herbaspirillum huttiense TaxID=863372 RepID=A0AAJ2HCP5_9BURK|nr:phage integrase SAM-like domain-containing protein [Herbaspirillum huttiense]MDR9837655.1 phage integrase SAM-like domain-containing protein [Herbaspirillum huttiense]
MANERKHFPKVAITTPSIEHERNADNAVVVTEEIPPVVQHVVFPTGSPRKSYNFSQWYGIGFDQITFSVQRQIERFLAKQDKELRTQTIITCCDQGLKYFLNFMSLMRSTSEHDLNLSSINRELIDAFISFLHDLSLSQSSKKNIYSATKSVLKALCDRELIPYVRSGREATFPTNPFPLSHLGDKGETPLSKSERKAVNAALKSAIRAYFDESKEITSELHAYAVLTIALHTGANTGPLIFMPSSCLRPHPKPNTALLVLYKPRVHSEVPSIIRDSTPEIADVDIAAGLRPATAMLIRKAIAHSDTLRSEAPEVAKSSIWLYRRRKSSQSGSAGEVTALTEQTLAAGVRRLVSTYKLVDADGKPLRLNVSRLRKTFTNQIYEILDGDIAATAAATGNTPGLIASTYTQPNEESAANWRFMGLALTQELLTNTLGATESTPTGRCSDAVNGEYAPKKESEPCTNFLNCLRCRNYVVTADDLYRLFSFMWRIFHERTRMNPKRWKKKFSHIARLIERDVIDTGIKRGVFQRKFVEKERERAFSNPHNFWKTISINLD